LLPTTRMPATGPRGASRNSRAVAATAALTSVVAATAVYPIAGAAADMASPLLTGVRPINCFHGRFSRRAAALRAAAAAEDAALAAAGPTAVVTTTNNGPASVHASAAEVLPSPLPPSQRNLSRCSSCRTAVSAGPAAADACRGPSGGLGSSEVRPTGQPTK
jgi:hypothetical protein